jgi:ribose transport system permease protein
VAEPIAPTAIPKPSLANDLLKSVTRLLAPLVILLVMGAFFAWRNPAYLSPGSLSLIGQQAAIIVIVGIGQTLIIIAGGIDLSVGSVVAFAGTTAAVLMLERGASPAAAALAGTLTGGLIGLFNGIATVRTKLHPFIITLGSMMMFRGLALALTRAQSTGLLPPEFVALGTGTLSIPLGPGKVLDIAPVLVVYIVVVGLAAHLMLTRTRVGRYCFAIGSNRESARLSGIPVDFWTTVYFVLAGLLFGFGGVVQVARLGIGDPKIGEGMELEAIAAAVIGGSSLSGGQGSIPGTILGALLMAALRQGLGMVHLDDYWQKVSLGAAIVIAVIYDRASRRSK